MVKRSIMPRHLLLFCFIMLFAIMTSGCSSILPAKEEKIDEGIKVLIVAFGSREPIPNMKVSVRDIETDELVTTATSDSEGQVKLPHLKAGRRYLFVPSFNDDLGLVKKTNSVAKIVKVKKDTSYVVLETYYQKENQRIEVPVVLQNPQLPHGCEITAMTAAFNYYGLNLSKMKMAKKYLPTEEIVDKNGKRIGPDPNKAYAGNPADKLTGTYIFAPAITKTAKKVARDYKSNLQVTNLTGASKKKIIETVQQGIPVMMWVTLDLSKPKKKEGWYIKGTDRKPKMYRNLHVVVLTGYEDDKVIVMDPLHGYVSHDTTKFFKSYKEMGSQAISIEK
ncbi:C39 family peptidase [uncultured Rummeliibacillus sp.]|uniref:C39 family peptidase n=1 Tax=uncultured Rummeliibacillus sp. TaxID=762292 RepID=UPI00261477E0|nr:C39 family peptidase [uncultured Rummeliibacillus sp.]